MRKLITTILILFSINSIGQITWNSYPNRGAANINTVNASYYMLNGVSLDSANTVKRGFLTPFQYNKLQSATSSQWQLNGSAIYYNAGNVGIGTSLPTSKLQVIEGIGTDSLKTKWYYQKAEDVGDIFRIYSYLNNKVLNVDDEFKVFEFGNYVGSTYSIGIRKFPEYALDVKGDINGTSYFLNGVSLDSANTVKSGFFTKYQYNKLQTAYGWGNHASEGYYKNPISMADNTVYAFRITGTSEDDYFSINTGTAGKNILIDETNFGVKMGVGKIPAYKLDIKGGVNADSLLINGSKVNSSLWQESGGHYYYNQGTVAIGGIPVGAQSDQLIVYGSILSDTYRQKYADGNTLPYYLKTNPNTKSTFVGENAGIKEDQTSNYYNTFIGHNSGANDTLGLYNTFVGAVSGEGAQGTSSSNTFIGYQSGALATTGNYNTALGHGAGYRIGEYNNNIFIGYKSGVYNQAKNGVLRIHAYESASAALDSTEALILGRMYNGGANQRLRINANVGIKTPASTYELDVNGSAKFGATLGNELAPALTTGNWTLGTGWQYLTSPDRIDKNIDGTGTVTPSATTNIVAGSRYKVVITVSAISGSTASWTLGGVSGTTITAATTYTNYITAATTGKLIITPVATALRITITSISIKQSTQGDVTIGGDLIANGVIKDGNLNPVIQFGNIASTGNIGIATTPNASYALNVGGSLNVAGALQLASSIGGATSIASTAGVTANISNTTTLQTVGLRLNSSTSATSVVPERCSPVLDAFAHAYNTSTTTDKSNAMAIRLRGISGNPTAGALVFENEMVDGISETTEHMRIMTSGKVGLGTTDPTDKLDVLGTARIGDHTTNYTKIDADGKLSYAGTARKKWSKITAASITITAGTSASSVTDLQSMADGTFYDLTEAAATPGIDMYVEFTSVTAFETVRVLGGYSGTATHSVGVQVYNWNTSAWNTFNAMQTGQWDIATAGGYILGNYQFTVFDDTNYIGAGGNAGKVRIRFYHTMSGNASHHLYIDEVSLRQ